MHISLAWNKALLSATFVLLIGCLLCIACQYVHCSLIGKSTFDSTLDLLSGSFLRGHFFWRAAAENQLLEKRVLDGCKGENQFDCCSFVSVACIDTIDHPSIELVATPSLSHGQVLAPYIYIQSTVRNSNTGCPIKFRAFQKIYIQHWGKIPLFIQ